MMNFVNDIIRWMSYVVGYFVTVSHLFRHLTYILDRNLETNKEEKKRPSD